MEKLRPDFIVLDGKNLLWRNADAHKTLSTVVDGKEIATGGVYGFLNAASRISNRYHAPVVVAWEAKGTINFRFKLFERYKERDYSPEYEEIHEEMDDQQATVEKLMVALGVRQYRAVEAEADDVMGRLAVSGYRAGKTVLLYSNDSDVRQLVNDRVFVCAPDRGKDQIFDADAVEEKHGVPPRLLAALKAMAGDSSDRIPGAPGIGPKTAAVILNHYGSLKKALKGARDQDLDWPTTERYRKIVSDSASEVLLYYKLTKISKFLRVEAIEPRRDTKEVVRILKSLKMMSLTFPGELNQLIRMAKR